MTSRSSEFSPPALHRNSGMHAGESPVASVASPAPAQYLTTAGQAIGVVGSVAITIPDGDVPNAEKEHGVLDPVAFPLTDEHLLIANQEHGMLQTVAFTLPEKDRVNGGQDHGFHAPPPSPFEGFEEEQIIGDEERGILLPHSIPLYESTGQGPALEAEFGGAMALHARAAIKKPGRSGKRHSNRANPPIPRCKRVWRRCEVCGHLNHVPRLFCPRCINPRRQG